MYKTVQIVLRNTKCSICLEHKTEGRGIPSSVSKSGMETTQKESRRPRHSRSSSSVMKKLTVPRRLTFIYEQERARNERVLAGKQSVHWGGRLILLTEM